MSSVATLPSWNRRIGSFANAFGNRKPLTAGWKSPTRMLVMALVLVGGGAGGRSHGRDLRLDPGRGRCQPVGQGVRGKPEDRRVHEPDGVRAEIEDGREGGRWWARLCPG